VRCVADVFAHAVIASGPKGREAIPSRLESAAWPAPRDRFGASRLAMTSVAAVFDDRVILSRAAGATKNRVALEPRSTALLRHAILRFAQDDEEEDDGVDVHL